MTIGKNRVNTSPVVDTTKNYLIIEREPGQEAPTIQDSFVVPETFTSPQINGTFTDEDGLIKLLYFGFVSREVDKIKIEKIIVDMTAKGFTSSFGSCPVLAYDDMDYYIDYENGYSIDLMTCAIIFLEYVIIYHFFDFLGIRNQ